MSGPKGYDAVLAERLRREQELAARRRSWQEIVRQLEEIATRCEAAGIPFDVGDHLRSMDYSTARLATPSDADLDRVEELARLRTAVAGRVDEEATALARRRARQALRELQHELQTETVFEDTDLGRVEAKATATTADRWSELLGSTGEWQEGLTRELQALVVSADAADKNAWLGLATRVSDAVRRENDRRARELLRDEFAAMTARVAGPVAATLMARVDAAADSAAVEALRPVVVAAIAAAELDAQRSYVIAQAIEVWRELGYEAGPEFVELALAGDAALLDHRDWPGHALQVRFSAEGTGIATNVVAIAPSDAVRDKEVEEDHCADLAAFQAGLAHRGVDAPLIRRAAAGQLPVQHLDEATVRERRRTRTSTRRATS